MNKRTIAVDWAVSKKVYASGGQSSATAIDGKPLSFCLRISCYILLDMLSLA